MDDELGELVRAAAVGDEAAWDKLVERFSGLVWAVVRAYGLAEADAADVFQVTWLRLVEHLHQVRDPERLGAWLATTARRECYQVRRTGGRAFPTDDLTRFELPDTSPPTPETLWLGWERGVELFRALRELTVRCQQLLRVLMASPPPSYRDVAAALDMPIGSIGPTRQRCIDQLRGVLKERGEEGEA